MIELLDREAPPDVRFLRAWLLPVGGGVGAKREPGDPFPFTLIQKFDGWENSHTQYGFYQFDHLAVAADGKSAYTACEDYARTIKRRMLYLRDHPWTEVDVPGWGLATADRVRCTESPRHDPYNNTDVERFIARYSVHLRLVTVAS
ncbi:head-tail adaptor [Mycobacterium phage BigNuz]|uniref:Tail terminator n=2 Tax=Bignuzvirus bignuz TaxID=1983736 RepID=G1JX27_9CAUD|nr:head-tail adaptor [Mycobacterium phage BigNuz]AEL98175.1 tail terminator [Mycobacterium phage BigNuz]AOT24851.1 tail terminator [Mycobacterium phage Nazo]